RLSVERIRRLEELGFQWELIATAWEEMFSALLEYKKAHGDCNVPAKWSENPRLGRWVHKQRRDRKKSRLSTERIRRLDEVGFQWTIHRHERSPKKPRINRKNSSELQ
ncbi:MAG: hypothetical protein GTO24_19000, partial [candidate division Zixibacteria bacterium]|nr:hypothetical protein [candidate division Zixibacteria bacterium]